jgi:hypothetical protein
MNLENLYSFRVPVGKVVCRYKRDCSRFALKKVIPVCGNESFYEVECSEAV